MELRLVTAAPAAHRDRARPILAHIVCGRGDAVRLAALAGALERRQIFRQVVLLAGETGDRALADALGVELGLPRADHEIPAEGEGTSERTAATLTVADAYLRDLKPDVIVLAAPADAALACALAAAKRGIAVAQLDSGLRSWDWTAPAEINRVVIDRLSDTLFTAGREAGDALLSENVPDGRIHTVGSTAVDALRRIEPEARRRAAWRPRRLPEHGYVLVALGPPGPGEDSARGTELAAAITELATRTPTVLASHPRTQAELDCVRGAMRVRPVGHLEFVSLLAGAGAVITDSASVQHEASAIGVACYTPRAVTEQPVTLTHGTNVLLGDDLAALAEVRPTGAPPVPCAVPLWDGRAAERAAEVLVAHYAVRSALTP